MIKEVEEYMLSESVVLFLFNVKFPSFYMKI